MAKINEIMTLMEETAQRASASPKDWINDGLCWFRGRYMMYHVIPE